MVIQVTKIFFILWITCGELNVTEPPKKWGVHHLKINRGILDKARVRKHTYEAYKDIIKVEIMLLQLVFRDYKIEKWKMLQKIEHLWKRNIKWNSTT
jgi:hypothetical protein